MMRSFARIFEAVVAAVFICVSVAFVLVERQLLLQFPFCLFALFYALSFVYFFVSFCVRIARRVDERRQEHDKQLIEQVTKVMAKFIDAKDIYTGGHSERVAYYSSLIARELGKGEFDCRKVYYCGLLHDCGKIAIPDAIVQKPEKLSREEYAAMQDHTRIGYALLKGLTAVPEACLAARYHHEKYDGSGYPDGLKGEEIPEFVRIVSVADAFDTMSCDRCYRKAFPRDVIIEDLKKNSGTQFDAKITAAFLHLIETGKVPLKQTD